MIKGTKVKIFEYRYGRTRYYGTGTYIGSEKILISLSNGLIPKTVKKFLVKGHIVNDLHCAWKVLK